MLNIARGRWLGKPQVSKLLLIGCSKAHTGTVKCYFCACVNYAKQVPNLKRTRLCERFWTRKWKHCAWLGCACVFPSSSSNTLGGFCTVCCWWCLFSHGVTGKKSVWWMWNAHRQRPEWGWWYLNAEASAVLDAQSKDKRKVGTGNQPVIKWIFVGWHGRFIESNLNTRSVLTTGSFPVICCC